MSEGASKTFKDDEGNVYMDISDLIDSEDTFWKFVNSVYGKDNAFLYVQPRLATSDLFNRIAEITSVFKPALKRRFAKEGALMISNTRCCCAVGAWTLVKDGQTGKRKKQKRIDYQHLDLVIED